MKKSLAILMLAACLCFSGCRTQELRLFTIVTAMAVDCDDAGYIITLESSGSREGDGMDIKPQISCSAGETISECLLDIQRQTGRYPYLRHTALMVLSQRAAEEKLENIFDYIINEHDIRLNTRVMMTKGQAGELFNDEDYQSQRILRASTSGAVTSTTADVLLEDLLYNIYADGADGYMPLTSGERTEGIALLDGFTPSGELDARLVPAFLMMNGLDCRGSITVRQDGKSFSFRIIGYKCRRSIKLSGGRPDMTFSLDVDLKAEDRLTGPESLYEGAVCLRLEEDMRAVITAMAENGSDALGIGQDICRYDNKRWKAAEPVWKELLSKAEITADVTASIDSTGRSKEEG